MDSIIAAHLPDLETWQSSCLLFDSQPYIIEGSKLSLFQKVVHKLIPKYGEITVWQKNVIKILFNDYIEFLSRNKILTIIIPPNRKGFSIQITFDSNDDFYEIVTLSNFVKHGRYISYYLNGNKEEECNYEHGKLQGKYIYYYKNGNIKIECNYEHGKLQGKYIDYYENGNIRIECNYEWGDLHEKYISYFENGNIRMECKYSCGELYGKYFEYDESGVIIQDHDYMCGRRLN